MRLKLHAPKARAIGGWSCNRFADRLKSPDFLLKEDFGDPNF